MQEKNYWRHISIRFNMDYNGKKRVFTLQVRVDNLKILYFHHNPLWARLNGKIRVGNQVKKNSNYET